MPTSLSACQTGPGWMSDKIKTSKHEPAIDASCSTAECATSPGRRDPETYLEMFMDVDKKKHKKTNGRRSTESGLRLIFCLTTNGMLLFAGASKQASITLAIRTTTACECLRCCCRWRWTTCNHVRADKKLYSQLRTCIIIRVPFKKFLHWASSCFSEHECFKAELQMSLQSSKSIANFVNY